MKAYGYSQSPFEPSQASNRMAMTSSPGYSQQTQKLVEAATSAFRPLHSVGQLRVLRFTGGFVDFLDNVVDFLHTLADELNMGVNECDAIKHEIEIMLSLAFECSQLVRNPDIVRQVFLFQGGYALLALRELGLQVSNGGLVHGFMVFEGNVLVLQLLVFFSGLQVPFLPHSSRL
jgi:hypothetical protein